MRKIRLLDEAYLDLQAGHLFYEKQATGLGGYFVDSLISDIDSLVVYAGIHPTYFGNYYRMLSKRFPFAIYYRLNAEEILVYAVLDCRREPAWLRGRLVNS
jgi:hypothetical protein